MHIVGIAGLSKRPAEEGPRRRAFDATRAHEESFEVCWRPWPQSVGIELVDPLQQGGDLVVFRRGSVNTRKHLPRSPHFWQGPRAGRVRIECQKTLENRRR